MNYDSILFLELYNNTVAAYLEAAILFLVLLVIFRVIRRFILSKIKLLEVIHPRFYDFLALYCALHSLSFTIEVDTILNKILIALIIIQCILSSQRISEYFIRKLFISSQIHATDQTMLNGLNLFARLILWTLGTLLLLSNIGVNVTSLTTSLGIGGIAVALAVQNILGDIFSSFSIYFDKPFEVGDSIVIGDHRGTVKKIGLKTTRIESVDGEELIISNKELTSSRIQNFKRMQKRRSLFTLRVDYATSLEQTKLIPQIISKIFDEVGNADLDHVNFLEFGTYSLNFEVVYFHLSGDYNEYAHVRELINLRIKEEFEKAGISFAVQVQGSTLV